MCAYLDPELLVPMFLIKLFHGMPYLDVTMVWNYSMKCEFAQSFCCCYTGIRCHRTFAGFLTWQIYTCGQATLIMEEAACLLICHMSTWPKKFSWAVKRWCQLLNDADFLIWSFFPYCFVGSCTMKNYQNHQTCCTMCATSSFICQVACMTLQRHYKTSMVTQVKGNENK